jgi:hypothetical protein
MTPQSLKPGPHIIFVSLLSYDIKLVTKEFKNYFIRFCYFND